MSPFPVHDRLAHQHTSFLEPLNSTGNVGAGTNAGADRADEPVDSSRGVGTKASNSHSCGFPDATALLSSGRSSGAAATSDKRSTKLTTPHFTDAYHDVQGFSGKRTAYNPDFDKKKAKKQGSKEVRKDNGLGDQMGMEGGRSRSGCY